MDISMVDPKIVVFSCSIFVSMQPSRENEFAKNAVGVLRIIIITITLLSLEYVPNHREGLECTYFG